MKQTEAKTFQTYVNSRQRYEKHPDAFTGGAYLSDAVIRLSKDNDGSYTISMPPIRNIEKEIKEIKNGK